MIAGLHIGSEVRSFKRAKMTKVALIAVVLMPLLYSALYLFAFWDPFAKIDSLPVALVNSDKGTTMKGKTLNAGEEVAQGLRDNDRIHWTEVSAEEAHRGVADGRYYFSLELPPDFSEAVASPNTDNPHKAQLIATYNDSNGYLSSMIGQNVMREVLNVVSNRISAEAVDKVLIGVMDAGSGLNRAAHGAGQLADGTGELRSGLGRIDDGAGELKAGLAKAQDGSGRLIDGTGELRSGMSRLKDGSGQLSDGTQQLKDQVDGAVGKLGGLASGVERLAGGADRLGAGATQIDQGVQRIRSMAESVNAQQQQQIAALRGIEKQLRAIPAPEAQHAAQQIARLAKDSEHSGLGNKSPLYGDIQRLSDGSQQLAYQLSNPRAEFRGGLDALHSGTGQLPGKLGELQSGVARLNDGAHQLDAGLARAANGAVRLDEGAHELHAGHQKLYAGAQKLQAGTHKASDGARRLDEGANKLHDKLDEGSRQVPSWNEGQRVKTAAALGGPVNLQQSNDSGTNTFGAGLAPMFFPLALFIGGIIVFVLIRPLQARAIGAGISALRAAVDGYLPAAIIGVLQSAVVVLVTVFGVGMSVSNLPGLFAFAALIAVVFMAINQAFIALLGPGPGKVNSLAFLMLMVVSSGGLYPVETQNKFFQVIHPFNPMTYAVNGLREVIYGFYDHRLPVAILALLLVGALALSVTAWSARKQRMWTMERLHPVLTS